MKKYTNTLLAILLSSAFIGCSSNNDTKVKEEANTTSTQTPTEETTPPPKAQTENKKMPKCYIKKGTPLTDNMITVHVKCKNGNIPIDEATVTLDNTVKSVDYKGTYFSDYIGFRNLQPSTTYKAVLEVVVGGKTLKDSVKIKTKEEKVAVTPTPTPIPTPIVNHNPPKWTKSVYDGIYIHNELGNSAYIQTVLDLDEVCISTSTPIKYSIIDIKLSNEDDLIDENFDINKALFIEKGLFKINSYPKFNVDVLVTIKAKNKYGESKTKVHFKIEVLGV